jgi:hypothetical protein
VLGYARFLVCGARQEISAALVDVFQVMIVEESIIAPLEGEGYGPNFNFIGYASWLAA